MIPIVLNDTIYTGFSQRMSVSEKNTWLKQKTLKLRLVL